MLDLITEVLGGVEFPAQVLGRTHRVYPASETERQRFEPLLTWSALNEILNAHRLEPPRLRLARGGDAVPVSDYCERRTFRRMPPWNAPLPHLVAAQLRDGATLVLDAIEEMHPPIRGMTSGLERRLRTGVQVNAYASWTAQEGFGVHWDDHDVLVVQVSGAKRWRIYGPTRTAPLYRDVAFDDTPPEWPIDEFTLRAGDVLHVPRGWWHAAAASTGQPSLHLTCGLTTHTGVDLLTWLVDELRTHDVVRADLPRMDDETGHAAWREEITKLITERLGDPTLIPAYLNARDAAYGSRGGFSLPHAVGEQSLADPGLRVRLTTPRVVIRATEHTAILEVAGQRWVLAPKAEALLNMLASGQEVTLGALAEAGEAPRPQVAALLRRLMNAGVVAVRDS